MQRTSVCRLGHRRHATRCRVPTQDCARPSEHTRRSTEAAEAGRWATSLYAVPSGELDVTYQRLQVVTRREETAAKPGSWSVVRAILEPPRASHRTLQKAPLPTSSVSRERRQHLAVTPRLPDTAAASGGGKPSSSYVPVLGHARKRLPQRWNFRRFASRGKRAYIGAKLAPRHTKRRPAAAVTPPPRAADAGPHSARLRRVTACYRDCRGIGTRETRTPVGPRPPGCGRTSRRRLPPTSRAARTETHSVWAGARASARRRVDARTARRAAVLGWVSAAGPESDARHACVAANRAHAADPVHRLRYGHRRGAPVRACTSIVHRRFASGSAPPVDRVTPGPRSKRCDPTTHSRATKSGASGGAAAPP